MAKPAEVARVRADAEVTQRWRWLFLAFWLLVLAYWLLTYPLEVWLQEWFPYLARELRRLPQYVSAFWKYVLRGQLTGFGNDSHPVLDEVWFLPALHPHHPWGQSARLLQSLCIAVVLPVSMWLFVQYPRAGEGERHRWLRKCAPQWVRAGYVSLLALGALLWGLQIAGLRNQTVRFVVGSPWDRWFSTEPDIYYFRRCIPLGVMALGAVVTHILWRGRAGRLLRFGERVAITGWTLLTTCVLLTLHLLPTEVTDEPVLFVSFGGGGPLESEFFMVLTAFLWASGCRLWLLFRYGLHKEGRAYVDTRRTFCAGCGYDLRGSVAAGSGTCPECGVGIPAESAGELATDGHG